MEAAGGSNGVEGAGVDTWLGVAVAGDSGSSLISAASCNARKAPVPWQVLNKIPMWPAFVSERLGPQMTLFFFGFNIHLDTKNHSP